MASCSCASSAVRFREWELHRSGSNAFDRKKFTLSTVQMFESIARILATYVDAFANEYCSSIVVLRPY